jgi:ubiquinone/menaquinone biosynthesis C-methylase UbiE
VLLTIAKKISVPDPFETVNRAFSKQSGHFDEEDRSNPVLVDLRKQVYDHVKKFMKPSSHVLELNAGTGIDAAYFVQHGHTVHATDISDGMIEKIMARVPDVRLEGRLTAEQLSYDELHKLKGHTFDYVFSNSGGLNCIRDLKEVSKHLPPLLKKGSYVTWVIMPRVCAWELAGVLKGHVRSAFRRFHRDGVMAHLEGEYFRTYYHSLSSIKAAFDDRFTFIASEGLAAISPPPHRRDFPVRHPGLYRSLRKIDHAVGTNFPFNRWADQIIVTFQFKG